MNDTMLVVVRQPVKICSSGLHAGVCVCFTHLCQCVHTHMQDFELELAGAHVMRVQISSKSLLKEETYAHGKIRVHAHACALLSLIVACFPSCSFPSKN